MKQDLCKYQVDYNVLIDLNYPLSNVKRFKRRSKIKYDMKNKMMFGMEYKVESDEIISKSMKNFKVLAHCLLGNKTFLLVLPKVETTSASMKKCNQVCSTHLDMRECILSIELLGILLNFEIEAKMRVKDENGRYKTVNMSQSDPSFWTSPSHPWGNLSF